MASYLHRYPGPTNTEEYSDPVLMFTDWLHYIGLHAYLNGASPGDGAPVGVWYLSSWGFLGGSQPWISFRLTKTVTGDVHDTLFRFSATLFGTLDPSTLFFAIHNLSYDWSSQITQANAEAWAALVGLASWRTLLPGIVTSWAPLTAVGTITSGASDINYTVGSRSGQRAGMKLTAFYSPSASELARGIRHLDMSRDCLWSDWDDGTINVAEGAVVGGQATLQVPVLVPQSTDASLAWTSFTSSLTNVIQSFSWITNTNVTNTADLGQTGHPATEPTGTPVSVFVEPNIQAKISDPGWSAWWSKLTTIPGNLMWLLMAAGGFFGWLMGSGVRTLLTGALSMLEGESVALVPIAAATAAYSVPAVIGAAATGVIVHEANSSVQVYQEARQATALERVATAAEAIEERAGSMPDEAVQALVDIAAALKAGTDPDVPTFFDKLEAVRENLQAVAETRQQVTVRVRGVEAEADTGALLTGP